MRLGGKRYGEPYLIPKVTRTDRMTVEGLPHSDPNVMRVAGLAVTLQPYILAVQFVGQLRDDRLTVFVRGAEGDFVTSFTTCKFLFALFFFLQCLLNYVVACLAYLTTGAIYLAGELLSEEEVRPEGLSVAVLSLMTSLLHLALFIKLVLYIKKRLKEKDAK